MIEEDDYWYDGYECPRCHGLGYIIIGANSETEDCPDCNGTGREQYLKKLA